MPMTIVKIPALFVLLGGEAGLRCGEIMALDWTDVTSNNGNSVSRDRTGRDTS